MKKFLNFIIVLLLLVVSEYFLLTELFSQKRVPVLSLSLVVTLVCIYGVIKFFKKNILTAKHTEGHS